MAKKQFIAVIDLGSTGNRFVIFDLKGTEIIKSYQEFPTIAEVEKQAEQNAALIALHALKKHKRFRDLSIEDVKIK